MWTNLSVSAPGVSIRTDIAPFRADVHLPDEKFAKNKKKRRRRETKKKKKRNWVIRVLFSVAANPSPLPSATTILKLIHFAAYGACWVCLCCHNPPNSDVDYGIFNVRTNVTACDDTRGCADTVRESTRRVDFGKKNFLAAPGNRTCVSDVTVRCSNQQSWVSDVAEKAHTRTAVPAALAANILTAGPFDKWIAAGEHNETQHPATFLAFCTDQAVRFQFLLRKILWRVDPLGDTDRERSVFVKLMFQYFSTVECLTSKFR